MAIDPNPSIRPLVADPDSTIDNELPAYRALSPLAIVSVILGLASIFVFTSLSFSVFGALAIVAGLLALRQIRKLPDVWTGEKPATFGIGVALVFTLTAFTVSGVQTWIYGREAAKFARTYATAIESGTMDDLMYLQAHPSARRGKTIKQVADEMKTSGGLSHDFEMMNMGLVNLGKRTTENPRPSVTFEGLISQSVTGMTVDAGALYKLTGGEGQKGDEYALVHIQGDLQTRDYGWHAVMVKYPHELKK